MVALIAHQVVASLEVGEIVFTNFGEQLSIVDGLLLALARLQELACQCYRQAAPSTDAELLDAAFSELRSQIHSCVVTSC